MTLILSPPYLKTIVMLQSFLSIQHTQKKVPQILNTKHIIIKQITMLLRDSQNNLSEAWDINSFFKTNPPPWSKRSKGVFGSRTKWNGMSWFHSTGMGRFRSYVWLWVLDRMGWLRSGVWFGSWNGIIFSNRMNNFNSLYFQQQSIQVLRNIWILFATPTIYRYTQAYIEHKFTLIFYLTRHIYR